MKSFISFLVIFACSVLMSACTKSNPTTPQSNGGLTGNFLAWTGSEDNAHSFTLVRVNGQTGSVSNIGGDNFFSCLDYSPGGTLYGVSDELDRIDPTSGSSTSIGTFRYASKTYILADGAAFSPDGKLYILSVGSSEDSVFIVNLSNAALTYVGSPSAVMMDMEFAGDGTLYGVFAKLFVLDPSDASTRSVIGSTETYVGSMTFGTTGKLYGIDIYPSTEIYLLDLNSGYAATKTSLNSKGLVTIVAERAVSESHKQNVGDKTASLAPHRSLAQLLALEKIFREHRANRDFRKR